MGLPMAKEADWRALSSLGPWVLADRAAVRADAVAQPRTRLVAEAAVGASGLGGMAPVAGPLQIRRIVTAASPARTYVVEVERGHLWLAAGACCGGVRLRSSRHARP